MAPTDREAAQRQRADRRRKRRTDAPKDEERHSESTDGSSDAGELLQGVREAGKTAVAAATVGAAMAAVRAIAERPREKPTEERQDEPVEQRSEADVPDEQPAPPPKPSDRDEPRDHDEAPSAPRGPAPDPQRLVTAARTHLADLLGKEADSVTGLEPSDDGWLVTLEVVEVSRIPASTDVLATYEVVLDDDAKLVRYRRGGRYYRSQAEGGDWR